MRSRLTHMVASYRLTGYFKTGSDVEKKTALVYIFLNIIKLLALLCGQCTVLLILEIISLPGQWGEKR